MLKEEQLLDAISEEVYFMSDHNVQAAKRVRYSFWEKIQYHLQSKLFQWYCSLFVKKKAMRTTFEKREDIRIDCILDEFSYQCYARVFSLTPLKKENYIQQLIKDDPDILFVESAWHSHGGDWAVADSLQEIKKITTYCKKRGILTVFWNKEDPVHFERFIKKARYFDYVFTTDENCIPKYQKQKSDHIYSLMFAAEPKLHHPLHSRREKIGDVVFAGTCYRNKYPDRMNVLNRMLYAASDLRLDIYDRNDHIQKKDYRFLKIFQPYVRGKLDYQDIDKAYKGYWINLNLNTVTDSNTMFSRRVFELLACGSLVVSNESKGIRKEFANLVGIGESLSDFRKMYTDTLHREYAYDIKRLQGVRLVMQKHTYEHRADEILKKLDIQYKKHTPAVAVIGKCENAEDAAWIHKMFMQQSYLDKALFLIKKTDDVIKTYEEVKKYDMIAVFDARHFYGDHYLMDLMLALKYCGDVSFIGKKAQYEYEENALHLCDEKEEYEKTSDLRYDCGMIKASVLQNADMLSDILKEDGRFHKEAIAIDRFNFVRYGRKGDDETLYAKINV